MTMIEIIAAIGQKHKAGGITINSPASELEIQHFEKKIGFNLPAEFKEFYSICNGFGCSEDIFNIVSLEDALRYEQDYGKNWFHFAEYMIYSDMWSLRMTGTDQYEIFNKTDTEVVLTSSLNEFLLRFLQGNVFEKGGLSDWREELK
jgi:hypothetical protein